MPNTVPEYPKGNPRLGIAGPGRPKGLKNKSPSRTREYLLQLLDELGFDTVAEGIKLFRRDDTPARDKVTIWRELMGYEYPKLRSSESTHKHEHTHIALTWGDNGQPNQPLGDPMPTIDHLDTVDQTVEFTVDDTVEQPVDETVKSTDE